MAQDKFSRRIKKLKPDEFWTKEQAWKELIKVLHHGEWMSFKEIQVIIRCKRAKLLRLLNKRVSDGFIETQKEEYLERSKGKTLWYDDGLGGEKTYKKRDGLLPRSIRYYRLRMDKIIIEVDHGRRDEHMP